MYEEPYKVLALKYRPSQFSELVGQDTLVKTLRNSFLSNRVGHAFLLHRDRGVGKTSTARLIAKAINCTEKKKNMLIQEKLSSVDTYLQE